MFIVLALVIVALIARPNSRFRAPITTAFDQTTLVVLFLLSPLWLVAAAAFVSLVFHLFVIWRGEGKVYVQNVLDLKNHGGYQKRMARHVAPFRWLFYGLYWPLLLVATALLAGVHDLFALVGIGVAASLIAWCGYVLERFNHTALNEERASLMPIAVAVLAWAALWMAIFVHFIVSVIGGAAAASLPGPAWVRYVVVIGVALVHTSVGVLGVWRYTRSSPHYTSNLYIERCYLLGEVAAMVIVAVPIFIGAFVY